MTTRIRDIQVAEAIAAEAGTDTTPELLLRDDVQPVLQLQPRPPLAVSGYIPGTVGVSVAPSALNFSHGGIFISGVGGAIGRVNWASITNTSGGILNFHLRRVDSPFTGFPSVRAVPGYINAGGAETGRVFSITKNDAVATSGTFMALLTVPDNTTTVLHGPWIINDGILMFSSSAINIRVIAAFGYETWPAIRAQVPG